jgi:hypothetical protein
MDRSAGRRRRRSALALGALALVACFLVPLSAPGTVAEQRARLPPPADCSEDPVAGYWKSHQYIPNGGDWYEFTLVVRRVPDSQTALSGKIYAHTWLAGPDHPQAGACGPEQPSRLRVSMEAKGEFKDGVLRFEGTSWKLDEVVCGSYVPTQYNVDRFSGKVDPALQEFQSVNNDGGRMVNHPTVFRRVGCLDDPGADAPAIDIEPPALFPDRSSSCDCRKTIGR